ncbi:MAG: helix-turn-helix transcriptional regulator, partial [Bacteroidota bacterium]
YPRYFVEISKRLTSHFSNINNLRDAVRYNHTEEGIFLKKVNALINSHLSDPEFKVDALASSMAISRIHLFRKLKAITGLSPQAYIRVVRLEEAKRLLQSKKEDLNVSEVCYRVGFSSKSHFTRSFQKAFGLRPSELNKVSM